MKSRILARTLTRLIAASRYNRFFGPLVSRLQRRDDFVWSAYTDDSYRARLEAMSRKETRQLARVSWVVNERGIVLADDANPLNPTHRLIYEIVLSLAPDKVCEFGFGAGDHLANIRLLLPEAQIMGFEVSAEQLALARERNGLHGVDLYVRDMTEPHAADGFEGAADVVFCNAVAMHIHGGRRHIVFLKNMAKVARRYVLIRENWLRHDFVKDVRSIGLTPCLVASHGVSTLLVDKLDRAPYDEMLTDKHLRRSCGL